MSPKLLRLTPHDEEIYTLFRKQFPDLTVQTLTEDLIKNEEAKKVRMRTSLMSCLELDPPEGLKHVTRGLSRSCALIVDKV